MDINIGKTATCETLYATRVFADTLGSETRPVQTVHRASTDVYRNDLKFQEGSSGHIRAKIGTDGHLHVSEDIVFHTGESIAADNSTARYEIGLMDDGPGADAHFGIYDHVRQEYILRANSQGVVSGTIEGVTAGTQSSLKLDDAESTPIDNVVSSSLDAVMDADGAGYSNRLVTAKAVRDWWELTVENSLVRTVGGSPAYVKTNSISASPSNNNVLSELATSNYVTGIANTKQATLTAGGVPVLTTVLTEDNMRDNGSFYYALQPDTLLLTTRAAAYQIGDVLRLEGQLKFHLVSQGPEPPFSPNMQIPSDVVDDESQIVEAGDPRLVRASTILAMCKDRRHTSYTNAGEPKTISDAVFDGAEIPDDAALDANLITARSVFQHVAAKTQHIAYSTGSPINLSYVVDIPAQMTSNTDTRLVTAGAARAFALDRRFISWTTGLSKVIDDRVFDQDYIPANPALTNILITALAVHQHVENVVNGYQYLLQAKTSGEAVGELCIDNVQDVAPTGVQNSLVIASVIRDMIAAVKIDTILTGSVSLPVTTSIGNAQLDVSTIARSTLATFDVTAPGSLCTIGGIASYLDSVFGPSIVAQLDNQYVSQNSPRFFGSIVFDGDVLFNNVYSVNLPPLNGIQINGIPAGSAIFKNTAFQISDGNDDLTSSNLVFDYSQPKLRTVSANATISHLVVDPVATPSGETDTSLISAGRVVKYVNSIQSTYAPLNGATLTGNVSLPPTTLVWGSGGTFSTSLPNVVGSSQIHAHLSTTYAPQASPVFSGSVILPASNISFAGVATPLNVDTCTKSVRSIFDDQFFADQLCTIGAISSHIDTFYAPKDDPTFTGVVTLPSSIYLGTTLQEQPRTLSTLRMITYDSSTRQVGYSAGIMTNIIYGETLVQSRVLLHAYCGATATGYSAPSSVAEACTILALDFESLRTNNAYPGPGACTQRIVNAPLDSMYHTKAGPLKLQGVGDLLTTTFGLYRYQVRFVAGANGSHDFRATVNGALNVTIADDSIGETLTQLTDHQSTSTTSQTVSFSYSLARGKPYKMVVAHLVPASTNPYITLEWRRNTVFDWQPFSVLGTGISQQNWTSEKLATPVGTYIIRMGSVVPPSDRPTITACGTGNVFTCCTTELITSGAEIGNFYVRCWDAAGVLKNSSFTFTITSRGAAYVNGEVSSTGAAIYETTHAV